MMQHKSLQFLMLFAGTVALSHTAVAGETLDRIKERGELIGVMDQAYPPYSFLNDKNEMDGMDVELTKEFARRTDPQGRLYFWLTGNFENFEPEAQDTDEWALNNGYVSIVPTKIDMTAYDFLEEISDWKL